MNQALLFLPLMFFNLACITKRTEVPADFHIRIESIPSQPQPGASSHVIVIRRKADSMDKTLFELVERDGFENHVIDLKYADVLKLYQEIVDQKIMRMKKRYSDMSVLDGGTTDLQLKMNGKEKRILLHNTTPPQLQGLFSIIGRCKKLT